MSVIEMQSCAGSAKDGPVIQLSFELCSDEILRIIRKKIFARYRRKRMYFRRFILNKSSKFIMAKIILIFPVGLAAFLTFGLGDHRFSLEDIIAFSIGCLVYLILWRRFGTSFVRLLSEMRRGTELNLAYRPIDVTLLWLSGPLSHVHSKRLVGAHTWQLSVSTIQMKLPDSKSISVPWSAFPSVHGILERLVEKDWSSRSILLDGGRTVEVRAWIDGIEKNEAHDCKEVAKTLLKLRDGAED